MHSLWNGGVGVPFSSPPARCLVKGQEQQLLSGEGSFSLSLDPSSHSRVLQAADAVGEILLSLSYLPTAERLTVVVVKAKNLIWTNEKTAAGKALLAAWLLHAGWRERWPSC